MRCQGDATWRADDAIFPEPAFSEATTAVLSGNRETIYPADVDVQSGSTVVSGANNLSPASRADMPDGTITDCPLLEPLASNGGPTQTLALRHTSPAIDAGNNLLMLPYDQRGPGYPRFYVLPDIGAWESQGLTIDDSIFHQGFDPGLGLCNT
ncbi:MAG TPA: choice-of-anchor Q domain-containing protein [Rudaea sp.]